MLPTEHSAPAIDPRAIAWRSVKLWSFVLAVEVSYFMILMPLSYALEKSHPTASSVLATLWVGAFGFPGIASYLWADESWLAPVTTNTLSSDRLPHPL